MKNVTVIPASRDLSVGQYPTQLQPKRRVAGYARVSTNSEDQFSSYEAQVDYYTTMIKRKREWEFVKIYTDEGISGTSTSKREGFKHMIEDALSGHIDLIITKSVSRFARNTVDSLSTIRKLKEHKVEVFFEKENIWTFDSKGELLITIMSSLAQEESRSISENSKWGRRKRFADGQVSVPYSRFLGYDKGPDGNLMVNPEQAKLVQYMFRLFIEGFSPYGIATRLMKEGYKTVTGGDTWYAGTVKHILRNEKYTGDALLQKYYIADFLTKKHVKNNGEIPQYFVKDNHEAIISREVFNLVQKELPERKQTVYKGAFSGRIRCGVCGGMFGHKIWHSNSKYRKEIWQCIDKYAVKGSPCSSPHISEEKLEQLYIKAVNQIIPKRREIIEHFTIFQDEIFSTSLLESQLLSQQEERTEIMHLMDQFTALNTSVEMDQKAYMKRSQQLSKRYEEINQKIDFTKGSIQDVHYRKTKTKMFLQALSKQENVVTEFSHELWHGLVDHGTIYSKEDIRFTFKNGMEITLEA